MAKKGKGALASALARHQSEQQQRKTKLQKLNNKEIHYPGNKKKPKSKTVPADASKKDEEAASETPLDEKKVLVPFDKKDRILIVGDGDFSYTLSIVKKKLIKAKNVIATSFDTLDELHSKYPDTVDATLQELRELGVTKVYHGIDGTRLAETLGVNIRSKRQGDGSGKSIEVLGGLTVNSIIFNFPHIGKHISDVERNIIKNQELLSRFFGSCREFFSILRRQRELRTRSGYKALEQDDQDKDKDSDEDEDEDGDGDAHGAYFSALGKKQQPRDSDVITVTVFSGEPYDSWKIKKLARDSIGYSVQRSGRLEWRYYDGYSHRRTAGAGSTNKRASTRDARIYKFEKWDAAAHARTKKRRRGDASDTDSDGA